MHFRQFYLESLGHASYLVGSEQTGEALVFDARRDVGDYFDDARGQGLRIRYAMDSHGHNDYLSGLTELDERATELEILGAGAADLGYRHAPLVDGASFEMGEVRLTAMHTPGHTPEHMSLLITDLDAGEEPAILLSGGALLVGDLARPDLLGGSQETQESARAFCRTIQEKLLPLPDHVQVFPTHVSGSLCGGSIGSRLSTTVGLERRTNALLAQVDRTDEFVESCLRLDDLPAVPPYWKRMRSQNMAGVPALGRLREPPALDADGLERRQAEGALVLDCRQPEAYGGGHVPGALNVGLGSSFATWAGTVLPADARVVLVLDTPEDLWEATWQLLRIGYPVPQGWLAGGMMAWRTTGRDLARLPQITVHELKDRLDQREVQLLDVRQPAEWQAGRAPGAMTITGAELPDRLGEVPDGPVAVTCGSGYRSSVAASLLQQHGRREVLNVLGGMSAWTSAGYPLEQ